MNSEIVNVKLSSIEANPMRQTGKYPFVERKIEALKASIRDVGLWEGMIARKKSGTYQLAFGHHRWHAAKKQLGTDARIPLIVRDLSDEQMVQFMGRENLEDYNADFLIMLESWEAGVKYLTSAGPRQNLEVVEIARLLGWLDEIGKSNHTARACSNTSRLIKGGYLTLDDVRGLSVDAVGALTGRVVAQHEMLERMAKATQRPAREVEVAKRVSGRAGRQVAKDVRAGNIAPREIRGRVDVAAFQGSRTAKPTPLFAMFGKSLVDQIAKVCQGDVIHEKFLQIQKSLNMIELPEDVQTVQRVALACTHAAERFMKWEKVFTNPKTKVVSFKALTHDK